MVIADSVVVGNGGYVADISGFDKAWILPFSKLHLVDASIKEFCLLSTQINQADTPVVGLPDRSGGGMCPREALSPRPEVS